MKSLIFDIHHIEFAQKFRAFAINECKDNQLMYIFVKKILFIKP